jgi:hypothetical protein
MKKNLILLSILSLVFTGCMANNQPKVVQEERKVEPIVVQEPVFEETKLEPKKVSNKKITYSYYRLIPSKIEVFAYKLSNNTIIDDRKLKNSFYLNGDKIRIEKIYTSKVGDKYGKIAGKYLIVSMDDLKKD